MTTHPNGAHAAGQVPGGQPKIKGFDGFRGLAVSAVVLTHLGVYDFLGQIGWPAARLGPMLNGDAGVQAFFVLSGFLITLLLVRESHKNGRISLRNFYLRRALRILPLYGVLLLLVTALYLGGVDAAVNGQALLFAYGYVYNFVPKEWYSALLGHTWTLAVEEHFYLVWPWLFGWLNTKRWNWLIVGAGGAVLIPLAMRLGAAWLGLTARFFVDRWTPISGSNIAAGCAMALVVAGHSRTPLWHGLGRKTMLVLGVGLYANSLAFPVLPLDSGSFLRAWGLAVILAWIYLNPASRLVRVLELPALRFIGVISYGIYIYQGFFLSTGPYRAPGQIWPPEPAIGVLGLIVVAPLSYQYFEKPFLQFKNRLSGSGPAEP